MLSSAHSDIRRHWHDGVKSRGVLAIVEHHQRQLRQRAHPVDTVSTFEDAADNLAHQIVSFSKALDVDTTVVFAPNRLTIAVQLATVISAYVLPTVAVVAAGDEHVFCTAVSILQRYVRVAGPPKWYEDDIPRTSFIINDSSDESTSELALRATSGFRGCRSGAPDDWGREAPEASERGAPEASERGAPGGWGGGAPHVTTVFEDVDKTLVDVALVAIRLAIGLVQIEDEREMGYVYSTLVDDIMADKSFALRSVRLFVTEHPGNIVSVLTKLQVRVLRELDGRIATATLYDMWSVFDNFMLSGANTTALFQSISAPESRTLYTMTAALVFYAQIDDRLWTKQPWISAAAIALLSATVFLTPERLVREVLPRMASVLRAALVAANPRVAALNDAEVAQIIVSRARHLHTGFLHFSTHPTYQKRFRDNIMRNKDVVVRKQLYVERNDEDIAALESHLEKTPLIEFTLPPAALDAIDRKRRRLNA